MDALIYIQCSACGKQLRYRHSELVMLRGHVVCPQCLSAFDIEIPEEEEETPIVQDEVLPQKPTEETSPATKIIVPKEESQPLSHSRTQTYSEGDESYLRHLYREQSRDRISHSGLVAAIIVISLMVLWLLLMIYLLFR